MRTLLLVFVILVNSAIAEHGFSGGRGAGGNGYFPGSANYGNLPQNQFGNQGALGGGGAGGGGFGGGGGGGGSSYQKNQEVAAAFKTVEKNSAALDKSLAAQTTAAAKGVDALTSSISSSSKQHDEGIKAAQGNIEKMASTFAASVTANSALPQKSADSYIEEVQKSSISQAKQLVEIGASLAKPKSTPAQQEAGRGEDLSSLAVSSRSGSGLGRSPASTPGAYNSPLPAIGGSSGSGAHDHTH